MDVSLKDLSGLIDQLAPGFLAAWIFYGLTTHSKPSTFERIIQALIFTLFVKICVASVRASLFGIGLYISFGVWTKEVELTWSMLWAVAIGLVFSRYSNNDFIHCYLRKWRWTKRSSFPSEWYSALRKPCWLILHLTNDRRLWGWPAEWPDNPYSGHFLICRAKWLLPYDQEILLDTVETVLVPATDIKMIEFIKSVD